MRNLTKTFLACALALAGFTACNKNGQVADNPNYNRDTDEVTTQFVFNVATSNSTKQSSDNTQAETGANFRGMEKAMLIPFTLANDGKNVAGPTSVATKFYDLDRILNAGEIDANKSRRVIELTLPIGTNAMMFYAKAIKEGTDAAEGKIEYSVDKDPSKTAFKLCRRLSADKEAAFRQNIAVLSFIETNLIKTSVNVNETFNGSNFTGTMTWKQYADKKKAGEDLSVLGEILADAFSSYTTIKSGELRAGSGKALATTNGDLWSVINQVATATPTNLNEAVAKAVAGEIIDRLSGFLTEQGANCKWKSMSNIKTALASISGAPSADLISADDMNKFPINYELSEGSTQLVYKDETPSGAPAGDVSAISFVYAESLTLTNLGGMQVNLANYMYPAEITYFGNSPLRVSDSDHVTNDYPQGVTAWDNDASWSSDWMVNSHVTSTTRSAALKNDVNYGTALLKTTVRYETTVLKDNKKALTDDTDDKSIPVTADAFILKGVIIGGQVPQVGWDFTRRYRTSESATAAGAPGAEKFNCLIYDTDIPNKAIPTGGAKSAPNYTLVFDNWDSTLGDNQSPVYVALEFENRSGIDFWGKHNLVRNGGTFYIIGKLSPADPNAGTITWPVHHALPPYNTDGSSIQQKRVFIQDYMTTADFKIGENSLKNAFLTVPDLRSSHVTLGLSVDIQWQTGLTFSDIVLGNY